VKKIIFIFVFMFGCIFSNSYTLKLPVRLRMNLKYLSEANFSIPGMLVNRLKIIKVKDRYQIYSLQIISYGDAPQENYSFYFAKDSKIRIFYASAIDKKAEEIKNYRLEKRSGKNVVYISKSQVASSPVFFIERVANKKVDDFFFYNFLPSLSSATQFSELDIDLGKDISIVIPESVADNTKVKKDKTRYKIIYSKDGDKLSDYSVSIFVCEKTSKDLFGFLSKAYYSQKLNLKNQAKTKFRSLYKGIKNVNRLIFMYEYLLKNSLSLKKDIRPKSTNVKVIHTIGDYARNMAAVCESLGYKNYKFVVPIFTHKKKSFPYQMVGLKVKIGGRDYWFFPTSRYAKGGLIPPRFQGKQAVIISERGEYFIDRLPMMIKSSSIFAYNTFYLTEEGMKYRTSLTFTGFPAEKIRNIINGWPRAVGHQKAASYLFGKNNLINSRYFRSIGRAIPHLPLKIKAGGLLTTPIVWNENRTEGVLRISLFRRLEKTQQDEISLNEKINLFKKLRVKCKESTIFKIPFSWNVKNMPLKKQVNNKYINYSVSCVLRRGAVIKKPRKWSSSDWKNWLKDNPGKKQDEIFVKRSFLLKPFSITTSNLSKVDAAIQVALRDKIRIVKK